ncbi:MAG TPA: monovalent cation/H+ antiporter complex subunit F [Accumulibacter sp.]|nr:monovalent cation/H+ antiporter complex subunit F [Accumulibacter sp.]
MNVLMHSIALFLLANLLIALVAAVRGPTPADRMLVALLFGTGGTGILALLALSSGVTAMVDVAVVLALLAAIGGIAFSQRTWRKESDDHH